MGRCFAIMMGFWVLMLSPTLCLGGLLEHLCDPHHCEQPCEPGLADRCEHETDCQSDPCSEIVRPDEDGPGQVRDLRPAPDNAWCGAPAATAVSILPDPSAFLCGSRAIFGPQAGLAPVGGLSCHQSDIPLLI